MQTLQVLLLVKQEACEVSSKRMSRLMTKMWLSYVVDPERHCTSPASE